MDLYHRQIVEGDVAMKLRKPCRRPGRHLQIAGVLDRHEPDSGELEYGYLFEVIDALGISRLDRLRIRPAAGTSNGLGRRAARAKRRQRPA
jgi:hydroxypyruvate isomerase